MYFGPAATTGDADALVVREVSLREADEGGIWNPFHVDWFGQPRCGLTFRQVAFYYPNEPIHAYQALGRTG